MFEKVFSPGNMLSSRIAVNAKCRKISRIADFVNARAIENTIKSSTAKLLSIKFMYASSL